MFINFKNASYPVAEKYICEQRNLRKFIFKLWSELNAKYITIDLAISGLEKERNHIEEKLSKIY